MRGARTLLAFVLLAAPCTLALNPALDISQYAHKVWRNSEGFGQGAIHSIAQTPDGYLWLGTEFGLFRFDGVKKTRFPHEQELPSTRINKLLVARDGMLWIGTTKGLASWNGVELTRYPEFDGQSVFALLEDRTGVVWASGFRSPGARVCS